MKNFDFKCKSSFEDGKEQHVYRQTVCYTVLTPVDRMHRYRMWKLAVMLWNKMGRNFGTLPAIDKSYKQVSTSNQAADANSSISLGLLHI